MRFIAVVRDYNGFVIERDDNGEVISMKADEKTESVRQKNKDKFGNRDEAGLLIKGSKKTKDDFTEQINESNKRLKKWQQEQ
jgi:hypothetical protein